MRRRVPVQNLRGSDPTLLEVQLQDLLRRPMGQLAPVNMLDLIALADTEGRPRSLERNLMTFVERISSSIGDLPIGAPWEEFLSELEEVEGDRAPHRFREMLRREAERSDRNPERIGRLLERWSAREPEPFELGQARAKVTRASAAPPTETKERRRATPSKSSTPKTRAPAVVTDDERERQAWIGELAIERLMGASENGLGEPVLVAGIRHRARERYPMLTPNEIITVLKGLKDRGQVRYSAGRWMVVARW